MYGKYWNSRRGLHHAYTTVETAAFQPHCTARLHLQSTTQLTEMTMPCHHVIKDSTCHTWPVLTPRHPVLLLCNNESPAGTKAASAATWHATGWQCFGGTCYPAAWDDAPGRQDLHCSLLGWPGSAAGMQCPVHEPALSVWQQQTVWDQSFLPCHPPGLHYTQLTWVHSLGGAERFFQGYG